MDISGDQYHVENAIEEKNLKLEWVFFCKELMLQLHLKGENESHGAKSSENHFKSVAYHNQI